MAQPVQIADNQYNHENGLYIFRKELSQGIYLNRQIFG